MGRFAAAPRTVKLTTIGSSVTGVVDSVDTEYQMNFTADNRPDGLRYDGNGQPVMTTVVYLILHDDKGEATSRVKLRVGDTIFTNKGRETTRTTSGLAVAIGEALDKLDREDLEVGDTITVTYSADGEADSEDRNPPKIYTVDITV